jgi:hypothetical protein
VTPDDPDRDLARRFARTRSADESAAPDLGELLARPRPVRTGNSPVRRLALAAAIVFVAAAAALLLRPRPPVGGAMAVGDLPPAAARLSAWKSPTASLLRTPGADLWARVPALVPRVPVFASVTLPQTTKGAAR